MRWILDDAGDLVNLAHIACIVVAPLAEEEADDDLTGSTHEVLAIGRDETSYRLGHGTETACVAVRASIHSQLAEPQRDVIRPPEISHA